MTTSMNKMQLSEAIHFLRVGINQGLPPDVILGTYPEYSRDEIWAGYQQTLLALEELAPPSVLSGVTRRPEWSSTFNSADGFYWSRLHEYLRVIKDRDESELASLDQASDEILFRLGDPKETGPNLESVRGLVVGYVQSGKTANYTALAAKAFDAGYRAVIVLTGIHNSLRRQTQIRLDNELGLIKSTVKRVTAQALRSASEDNLIIQMTSEDLLSGDFAATISNDILRSGKYLFVTKKNKSVLERLNSWLGDHQDLPALIIDDEADQASVNTAGNRVFFDDAEDGAEWGLKDENSPTAINSQIRKLVNKFSNVSYVGYTATPYANVFIEHDAVDRIVGDDLYPKDFIISLPKPRGYFGPEEFFGVTVTDEEGPDPSVSDQVIRVVKNEEVDLLSQVSPFPQSPKDNIPESLQVAVTDFFLALSIRHLEYAEDGPGSMLVHTSHKADEQRKLQEALELYVRDLRANWRYKKDESKELWKRNFERFVTESGKDLTSITFELVEEQLEKRLGQFSALEVLLFNHLSEDELDYELNPNLTAIVVGGNKLSRGLTIEGLLVSYFVRPANAPKADTLTQMGRFFGYRQNVYHLTRIYTTEQLKNEFKEIALVESSLRKEIHRYALAGKTPYDFAPRVLKRTKLMPTARNRMKSAKVHSVSYSGDLVQTTSFPLMGDFCSCKNRIGHNSKLEHNEILAKNFLNSLLASKDIRNDLSETRWLFEDVPALSVLPFIEGYQVIAGATRFETQLLSGYIRDLNEMQQQELITWDVAVIGRKPDQRLGTLDLDLNCSIGQVERSVVSESSNSIGSLINPLNLEKLSGDELLGLTSEDINDARELKRKDPRFSNADALRTVRSASKGLLCVYPISLNSRGSTRGKRQDVTLGEALSVDIPELTTVIGLSLVFPHSNEDQSSREFWIGTAGSDE